MYVDIIGRKVVEYLPHDLQDLLKDTRFGFLGSNKRDFLGSLDDRIRNSAETVLSTLKGYNLGIVADLATKPTNPNTNITLQTNGSSKRYFAALDHLDSLGAKIEFDKDHKVIDPSYPYFHKPFIRNAKATAEFNGTTFNIYLQDIDENSDGFVLNKNINYLNQEIDNAISMKYANNHWRDGIVNQPSYLPKRKRFALSRFHTNRKIILDLEKHIRANFTSNLFRSSSSLRTIPTARKFLETTGLINEREYL